MSENYIFSYDQLKVLVLGYGCSRITGLKLNSAALDNEAALIALNQLSNEGIITSDGKRFFASEQVKLIAQRLGASDIYIAVHTSKAALPDLCCYPGDSILVCNEETGSEGRIAVKFLSFEEFFENLYDEGYLPEDSENMPLEEKPETFENFILENYNPNAPIKAESNILFSVDVIDKSGVSRRYLRLIEYYYYNYILFCDNGRLERTIFTRNAVKKQLKRLMSKK